ncbi:DUF4870 domain-containing protein [Oceanobacillus sp. CAU 1775]
MKDPNTETESLLEEAATETTEEKNVTVVKTSSGLEENLGGALAYLLGAVTGIIFLIIEKDNRFIRFHAFQSIFIFIAVFVLTTVLSFIPIIGWIVSLLLSPVILILWLFMMWKAYQGEMFKLPIIGDIAEQQVDK